MQPEPEEELEDGEASSSRLAVATPQLRLSPGHLARVEGWGMAVSSVAHVYQPVDCDGVEAVFQLARRTGRKVCPRGGGNSYGDAAILGDSVILDTCRMNRILDWNPDTGVVDTEPGVTIRQLWRRTLPDGWWPPVVSGTMHTTMGGCAAMNIHGKNNFKVGPFGEHITEFDLMLPSGETRTVTPASDPALFYGAISGAGLFGVFTRLRLQMKRIYSGLLSVEAFSTTSISEMAMEIDRRAPASDYLVGWVDCMPRGKARGRGVVHAANYLPEDADPRPADTLTISAQELPTSLLGIIPKSMLHLLMAPFINNFGVQLINSAKFHSGKLQPRSQVHYQSHGAFAFLLDYVPNWKLAYRPVGLIQHQAFLPKATAVAAYDEMLKICRRAGLPPYLGVFKKHRPDNFLLTHAVDGYSLALDFRVTRYNRDRLWHLTAELDSVALQAGARFYFAKDATLSPETLRAYLGEDRLQRLRVLKQRCDPEAMLETSLTRRLNLSA